MTPSRLVEKLSLLHIVLIISCRQTQVHIHEHRNIYNGIPAEINFPYAPGKDIASEVWKNFVDIGKIVDAFNPISEVGILNRSTKEGVVKVSDDLDRILLLAKEVSSLTDNAFDPTIWHIKILWKEAEKRQRLPTKEEIDKYLASVGIDKIKRIDTNQWVFEVADAALDLGGIAKGYVVDKVAQMAQEHGVKTGLVRCGGEIVAWGNGQDGRGWQIGVQHPIQMDEVIGVIVSKGFIAVSTSGNYRQPLVIEGQEYHHILDPRSGTPVNTSVLGVTVVVMGGEFPCSKADALATAFTVLDLDRALSIAESLLDVAVLFLVREEDGIIKEIISSRMKRLYISLM